MPKDAKLYAAAGGFGAKPGGFGKPPAKPAGFGGFGAKPGGFGAGAAGAAWGVAFGKVEPATETLAQLAAAQAAGKQAPTAAVGTTKALGGGLTMSPMMSRIAAAADIVLPEDDGKLAACLQCSSAFPPRARARASLCACGTTLPRSRGVRSVQLDGSASCSAGFERAACALRGARCDDGSPVVRDVRRGDCLMQSIRAADAIRVVADMLRREPTALLCADDECAVCEATRRMLAPESASQRDSAHLAQGGHLPSAPGSPKSLRGPSSISAVSTAWTTGTLQLLFAGGVLLAVYLRRRGSAR